MLHIHLLSILIAQSFHVMALRLYYIWMDVWMYGWTKLMNDCTKGHKTVFNSLLPAPGQNWECHIITLSVSAPVCTAINK